MLASRTAFFGPRRSAVRLAVTTSATLGLLFFLCWLGARVSSLPFSHMFVQLFTAAPVAGLTALREGLFSSLAAGAAAGFFFTCSPAYLTWSGREIEATIRLAKPN